MSTSVFDQRQTAPTSRSLEKGGHGVEFYGYDAQIICKVADFLAPGLDTGEGAIVIATDPHRRALDGELASRGFDVKASRASGQLLTLDAASTLSRFLIGGELDRSRFEDVIGGAIEKVGEGKRPVRAYGEMVALLWLAGRPSVAIALESLWNDLAKKLSFTLLCGYPISAFATSQAEQIADIGRTHTQIAPLERSVRPAGA